MNTNKRVYILDPQKLSAETIAVTFAKTSRSPHTFEEIASELTAEKSAQFHEKWVVGYGHSSVAEHAVLHIAIENVSRLAVENIQSNRLASFTEKSTRYQKWGGDQFYIPAEIMNTELKDFYVQTCNLLFNRYKQFLPILQSLTEKQNPRLPDEKEEAWKARLRTDYIDVCRFLLPAASLANVGVTINARALEHAIRKMLSDPLEEVQSLGMDIKQVAQAYVPTLVKYAESVPYLIDSRLSLRKKISELLRDPSPAQDWCRLVNYDKDAENRILAAALYRFSSHNYEQVIATVQNLPVEEKEKLAAQLICELEKHVIPLREFEHASFSFDVTLDQGAYYELKRHRMMTQTPQSLTTRSGYATPTGVYDAGLFDTYQQAMELAQAAYTKIAEFNPDVAAYLVPNGFNRRVLLTLNLRSAIHLINLRSSQNAHFSMRRLALRMAEEIKKCMPHMGKYLFNPRQEKWQEIEAKYFYQLY